MAPILFTVFEIKILDAQLLHILLFWIPMNLLINKMFQLYTRNIRTSTWSDIYETIMMPTLMTAILLETFGIKQKRFEVTDKEGLDVVTKQEKLRFAFPHLLLLGLSFYGILVCLSNLFKAYWTSYIMALIWLVINFYNLIMAIFFALGRPLYQNQRLFQINGEVEIDNGIIVKNYPVLKLSEKELLIKIDDNEAVESSLPVELSIKTDKYQTKLLGIEVEVIEDKMERIAKLKIEPRDEQEYQRLILMLFDREPVLPTTIQKKSRFYYLKQNMIYRFGRNKKSSKERGDRPFPAAPATQ